MRLEPLHAEAPPPSDVATALADASRRLGHRPAVTVLSIRGREEQGVASLAQWAAKGAHLLELDLLLEPGVAVRLDAPLSWTTAAVCLAVWWSGAVVALDDASDAEVAVVHERRDPPPAAREVLWLGDAIDGASHRGESWVRAVQAFPDQPPAARGGPFSAALAVGERSWTQADLIDLAGDRSGGTLGLDGSEVDPVIGLVAVTLRPLVVGRPTVVLQGVDRAQADGEQVARWL